MKRMILAVLFTQVFALSVQAQFTDLPSSGGFSAGDNGGGGGGGGRRRARPAAAAPAAVERPDINVQDTVNEFRREIDKVRNFNNAVCSVIAGAVAGRARDRRLHGNRHHLYRNQNSDYLVLDGNLLSDDQRSALNMDNGDRRILGTYGNLSSLTSFCSNWVTRRTAIYAEYDHIDALMNRVRQAGADFNFVCEDSSAPNSAGLVAICRQMQGELRTYINNVMQQINSLRSIPHSGIVFAPEVKNEGIGASRRLQQTLIQFLSN